MTRDLRDLLAAAGVEERAAADPLDVAALLGRAHRRRAVRGATYSAVGLGATAVIAIGAVSADGLWRDEETPVPPATTTTTATTAPRPTRAPTAEPADVAAPAPDAFAPDWELCGKPDPDDWESPYWIEPDTRWAALTDGPVSVDAELGTINDASEVTVRVVGAHAVAMSEDLSYENPAVVVAVAAAPFDATVTGPLAPGAPIDLPHVDVPLTSCAASPLTGGDGSLTAALDPAGWYALVLTVDVTTADGVTTRKNLQAFSLGTEPAYDQEPAPGSTASEWTIREFRADGAQPVPLDSTVRLPVGWGGHSDSGFTPALENLCGAASTPWPPEWLTRMGTNNYLKPPPPPGVANPFGVAATGFREGAQLIVQVTTTNTGSAVNDAWIVSPGVTIVKDGQIVGWRHMWNNAYAPATWGSGQTVQLEFPLGETTCTFMRGEPWPAGTYEVYVHQAMDILPQSGYATRWSQGVTGGPITFTLN